MNNVLADLCLLNSSIVSKIRDLIYCACYMGELMSLHVLDLVILWRLMFPNLSDPRQGYSNRNVRRKLGGINFIRHISTATSYEHTYSNSNYIICGERDSPYEV
jgi:hypothetical protein